MTMVTPTLETERLLLRRPAPRDVEGFIGLMTSERSRHMGGPKTRAEAWRGFCTELAHWDMRGYGMFAVTMKGDDTCLGLIGPWFPEGWAEHEIGWTLWAAAEGRGIGAEAAQATRSWAYDELGWTTAVSYIAPENGRSRRLAERIGARIDPDAKHNFGEEPVLIYRHPSPEDLG